MYLNVIDITSIKMYVHQYSHLRHTIILMNIDNNNFDEYFDKVHMKQHHTSLFYLKEAYNF